MTKETLLQIIIDHSQSTIIHGCRQQVVICENFESMSESIISEINKLKFYTCSYECDGVEHVEIIASQTEAKTVLFLSEIAKKCGFVISELNLNMPGNIVHYGGNV